MTYRKGFTLVELMVVLVVLVALAGVAMLSTESVVEQARYDASVKTLDTLEEGIIGPDGLRQPDGTLIISGFVADMGRLPNGPGPMELLIGTSLKPSALQSADLDSDVKLFCGWRGPYVRPPTMSNVFTDSWGKDIEFRNSTDVEALASQGIVTLFSSNNGGTPLERILNKPERMKGVLLINITAPQTTDPNKKHVITRIYGVKNGENKLINQFEMDSDSDQQDTYSELMTIGPIAVRVYRYSSEPLQTDNLSATTNLTKSRIVYRTMIPSGTDVSLTIE